MPFLLAYGVIVLKPRPLLIIGLLLLVITSSAVDIVDDFSSGQPVWHITVESVIICLAMALITYLIVSHKRQARHLQTLKQELKDVHDKQAASDSRIAQARKQYSELILQQFAEWQLSQSEQEIAMLLLKGLSFNEIATLRQTREKTVRQQASDIYRKSGVAGRHAFSAWFFEDFLN